MNLILMLMQPILNQLKKERPLFHFEADFQFSLALEKAFFHGENEYISKVAKTEKEICSLIEAGFEYVTDFEGAKIFRKAKM